jgi:hypothetical protein
MRPSPPANRADGLRAGDDLGQGPGRDAHLGSGRAAVSDREVPNTLANPG